MFENIKHSFTLIQQSWTILKKDKELLMFPVISGVLTILLFASFIIPLVLTQLYADANAALGTPLLYATLFLFYLLSSIIIIFFNVALISCAKIRLEGKDPTLKDGFHAASKHIGKIISWSILNATVGLIIRIIVDKLEERSPFIASIVSGLLGAAWSILTFFVIPVMIFENKGVFQSISESGSLIKHSWGERLGAGITLGLGFAMLFFIAAIPLALGLFIFTSTTAIIIGAIITILLWIVIGTISSALNGIFIASLYHYIKTGTAVGYSSDDMKHTFVAKKR